MSSSIMKSESAAWEVMWKSLQKTRFLDEGSSVSGGDEREKLKDSSNEEVEI